MRALRSLLPSLSLILVLGLVTSSCADDTTAESTAAGSLDRESADGSADEAVGASAAPADEDTADGGSAADATPTPGEERSTEPPTITDTATLDPPTFPLSVSADRGHLVDADGDPFLIHGDAAWSLIVQLDEAETADYLADRAERGFNTLVVNLIEADHADDAPRDEAGRAPFAVPGDFTTPQDDYFDAAAAQIQQARDAGFMVLLAPAYMGFDGGEEGFYADMVAAGEDALRSYGRYVGERFADLDNIIWVHAGDFTPPPEGRSLAEAVDQGLREGGAAQLRTVHGSPEDSGSDVGLDIPLDIDTTYTYELTHLASRADETDAVFVPHFLFETRYEDEGDRTRQQLRAQPYRSLLSGAAGQVYGHSDIWQFAPIWRDALDAPGAQDQVHVRQLFERLPWPQLEPDLDAQLVVEGSGDYQGDNFAVAAATEDRGVAVVYYPEVRTIALDLAQDPTGAEISWFDPVDGSTTPAGDEVELTPEGVRATPPGSNAGGDSDWVLLVDLNAGGAEVGQGDGLERVAGAERIATSVAVSQRVVGGVGEVVLASAANFPDALVGGPLAARRDAALLLTSRDRVPAATLAEIRRLGAARATLMGGTGVISAAVADQLEGEGLDVQRISGADRTATAVEAGRVAWGGDPPLVVLASGFAFADALAGAGLAASLGAPLLLSDGRDLSAGTAELIGDAEVLAVGGPSVMREPVLDQLRAQGASPARLGGQDRYGTAAQATAETVRRTGAPSTAWIATGRDFPDALVAAPAAVRDGGVLVLTEGGSATVPGPTAQLLADLGTCRAQVRLVGGPAAIGGVQADAVAGLLAC